MTISWRATLGYGFRVDLSNLSEHVDESDDLLQDFGGTVESRYALLDMGYAGNLMSGADQETWIFIKESVVELRDWTVSFDIEKLNGSMSGDGLDQLFQFVYDTGAAVGGLEWKILLYCG